MIYNKSVKIQQKEGSGGTENACRTSAMYLRYDAHPLSQSAPAGEPIIAPHQGALTNSISIVPAREKSTAYNKGSLALDRRTRRGFQMFSAPPLPSLCWPIPIYFRICLAQLPYRAAL
jgi:hypothetical protein